MRSDLTKPYSDYNEPDPNSQDFKDVMAWLKAHGAPEPEISYYIRDNVGYPNGGNPGAQMVLTFGEHQMEGDLVMNAPGVVLLVLGNYAPGANFEYAPPEPPEPPTPPATQPKSPIGELWFVSNAGVETYYPATGDTLPGGARHTQDGFVYVKTVLNYIGGLKQGFWEKVGKV